MTDTANKIDSDYCANCKIPLLYPDKPCPCCGYIIHNEPNPKPIKMNSWQPPVFSGIKKILSYIVNCFKQICITTKDLLKSLLKKSSKLKKSATNKNDNETNHNFQKQKDVYYSDTEMLLIYNEKKKNILVAYLLYFIVGMSGAHHLYLGKIIMFFIYIFFSLLFSISLVINFLSIPFSINFFFTTASFVSLFGFIMGLLLLIDLICMHGYVKNKNLKILNKLKQDLNKSTL